MGGVARITAASSDDVILALLHETADAIAKVLAANDDWSLSGLRATQYSVDVKVDAAALEVLGAAGVSVLSEESAVTGEFGADGLQLLSTQGLDTAVLRLGLPDRPIEHGTREQCLQEAGLDVPGIFDAIARHCAVLTETRAANGVRRALRLRDNPMFSGVMRLLTRSQMG